NSDEREQWTLPKIADAAGVKQNPHPNSDEGWTLPKIADAAGVKQNPQSDLIEGWTRDVLPLCQIWHNGNSRQIRATAIENLCYTLVMRINILETNKGRAGYDTRLRRLRRQRLATGITPRGQRAACLVAGLPAMRLYR